MSIKMETKMSFTIKDEGLKLFLEQHLVDNKKDRDFESTSPYYKMKDELFIKRSDEIKDYSEVHIHLIDDTRFKSKVLIHKYRYSVIPYDSICNRMQLVDFVVVSEDRILITKA